jgi:hypothetical protein
MLSLLTLGLSCAQDPQRVSVVSQPIPFSPLKISLQDLNGKSVESLEIVVLKQGLSQKRWGKVFTQIAEMHQLRSQLRISKSDTNEAQKDQWTSKLSEIIIDLFESDSSYLLQWGAIENCSIQQLALQCSPLDESIGFNPLNGGMPLATTAWIEIPPDSKRHEKTPSYSTILASQNEEWGSFQLQLRLKPEEIVGGEWVLKGEVEILPGSYFLRLGEEMPHDPLGYAELRLK